MVRNYEIGAVQVDNEHSFMRNVELKTERVSLSYFTKAVSPDLTERYIRERHIPAFSGGTLEIHMPLDLAKLRYMDSDEEKRAAFFTRNFPENLQGTSLLSVVVLTIDIKVGDEISEDDVEYINDILMWEANDIYITPILKFQDGIGTEDRVRIYDDFVKRLLEEKNKVTRNLRVGMSVPFFYPRKKINNIFGLYSAEDKVPQFVLMDFARSRLTSHSMIGKIQRVKANFNEEGAEKYYLYGFNVKPHKRGDEVPLAEDVGTFLSGLNSIGKTYRLSDNPVRYIPTPDAWWKLPKAFTADDYKYHTLEEKSIKNRFKAWSDENLGTNIDADTPKGHYYKHISRYNNFHVNQEVKELSTFVKNGEADSIQERIGEKAIAAVVREQLAAT